MSSAHSGPMGEVSRLGRCPRRSIDRRAGVFGLLAHLVSGLADLAEPAPLRARLEDGLRRLVPSGIVRLREPIPGVPYPPDASDGGVRMSIPGSRAARWLTLEVGIESAADLDDWDRQVLQAAGYVVALVLEIEQTRMALGSDTGRRLRRSDATVLIGSSRAMRAVRDRIARVARTNVTILIEGETGSGKELVARRIHELSPRRRGPFVAVNCAALVETLVEAELFGIEDRTATGVRGRRGKFEHADGGTLFLDEVADLAPASQAKLLRALQELAVERVGGHGVHPVDTRIVVATNRSLTRMVEQGHFRPDLFYRLNGVDIQIPPLRARREDIPELAACFLQRCRIAGGARLSAAAEDALRAYAWPGNVRELEHAVENAAALAGSDEITLADLPPAVRRQYADVLAPSVTAGDTMRAWGSRYARLVLEQCGRNKRRACEALDISYHTLQAYLQYDPYVARLAPTRPASSLGEQVLMPAAGGNSSTVDDRPM